MMRTADFNLQNIGACGVFSHFQSHIAVISPPICEGHLQVNILLIPSWFHSWYDSFHLIQSWLKLQRWHFYMIPNDIEWWISVNPYAIYCNHSEWDNLIFQYIPMTERGSEIASVPVFHTDPHSSILVFTLREWLTEATNMGNVA